MNNEDNHLLETFKSVLVPIHPAGWRFIAIFAGVSLLLAIFSSLLGWAGAILTLWCVYFFRDPVRVTPTREGLVVSAADGVVQKIVTVVPPAELEMGEAPLTRISIFLNVFDVHVNRVPVEGTVTAIYYHPGKFLNASLDKASGENERQLVKITTPDGKDIGCVQIAGLVARRIVCDLHNGQKVSRGARYGLIRFGSRTDIYLPEGISPLVVVGQRAIGGETVLADLHSNETARLGVAH